jgi:putative restriction endonuclease
MLAVGALMPVGAFMKGVIAVTDHEWFDFLSRQHDLDEVNFWRPRDTQTPHIEPGTPFLFKLKRRYGDRIVGFGIFARHSVLPVWVAWDAFGKANGAESLVAMRRRIERLRRERVNAKGAGDYAIGCVMLSGPMFFDRADWIGPPSDWSPNIVQGKMYDLMDGEGARIWSRCLTIAAGHGRLDSAGAAQEPRLPRYGEPTLIRPRLGQGTFRIAVMDAYGRSCAVTTEHSLPVLEAAHIQPYAEDGPHEVANGLLLRTDIHRLFDAGYVTVSPEDLRFQVSRRLKDDYENGRTYYALHGTEIHMPHDQADKPGRSFLEWHASQRFRG